MTTELINELPEVLAHFDIFGKVVNVTQGPLITDVEVELEKGSKFAAVEKSIKDIARELGISGIRVAMIPNSKNISFELPQEKPQSVPFSQVLKTDVFKEADYALPICVGVNMHGKPLMKDLSKMPHLLVAGTTGSGKSVGLNSFILSLINKKTPDELQFVLIDPKRIEFSMYNKQKYMLLPVITEMSEAAQCLQNLCAEMDTRYALFEQNMVRNIGEYVAKGKKMPYIVCVIDEFADLMMFDKAVEKQVQRLAQKARAAGIHLMIATQRPSVNVITGTVKANLPTRLSYKVSSATDSMTILNTTGAEDLIGRGDSLLLEENGTLTRILGAYVSNDDIMKMLEPYRCEMKEKKLSIATVEDTANSAENIEYAPEKKKSLWSRIADFWDRIGRRNQTRIINWIITAVMAAFGFKASSSNGTTRRRKTTSISATAKKEIARQVLKSLKKK